jgi:poly-gamma-glutamate synthesis protein (capsule biosynthesis protein)
MNILISGDLFVSDDLKNQSLVSPELIKLFNSVDYRIVNLETPLTGNNPNNKIIKTGIHLRSSPDTIIPVLNELKIDLVTLANNHIMDYGKIGLIDTINACEKNKIDFVGAGRNKTEAQKTFFLNNGDTYFAIINIAENEWASAKGNLPGANPMDIIDNVQQIRAAKKKAARVIVIIHGGHEFYNLPSPRMVKQYRFYAESGADVIIGHHTHCISGFEVYNGVPIFYGLGNFLLTLPSKFDQWYMGLILQLNIFKGNQLKWKLIPIRQNKQTFRIEQLMFKESYNVVKEVEKYSKIINCASLLKDCWDSFLRKNSDRYLYSFSILNIIRNKYIKTFIRLFKLKNHFLHKESLMRILNLIRCEAHCDVTKGTIEKYLSKYI